MSDAVIVSTARSPIGRAAKGSMTSIRPDDLAAQMVRAALDKVPALDPHDVEDLMMGCGQPGGESGFNIGRQVAVLLGYDFMPGTTVNRYCSSSLQTSRMAFHAIKAGEGDVFISAGVETVSRYPKGNSDGWPDTHNPLYAEAEQRTAKAAESGAASWVDPRSEGNVPDVYIAMGQTAENLALYKDVSREDMDHFGVRSQNLAEQALANGFWARGHHPDRAARRHGRVEGRRPARRRHLRGGLRAQAGVPSGRTGDGGQLLPAQRRRCRRRDHVGREGGRAGADAAGTHRRDRRQRAVAGDHGARPGRGVEEGTGATRA